MNNQAAHLTVTIDNLTPKVGEMVTFTFAWDDADADVAFPYFCAAGSRGGGSCVKFQSLCGDVPTGPWEPPRPRGAHGEFTERIFWDHPGTYEWGADVKTASSAYPAWADAHPPCPLPDPYASSAGLNDRITVTDRSPDEEIPRTPAETRPLEPR